ncbi:MAG: zinc-dependent dehydrogenase [Candidatus Omnitrophota bacterium]
MRVGMYYNNNDVRVEKLPRPAVGKGEIIVRVESAGICGSDVMEWYRINRTPLVLGHEISGIIEEVGEGVGDFHPGQRVACAHHVPCMSCRYCLGGHETVCDTLRQTNFYPGGFAEFIRLSTINVEKGVYLLPDSVSFDEATFVEPLACVLRGQRLAGIKPGTNVLVLGSGIAGLMHIQLAKINKAARVIATDLSDYRLLAAKRFGADIVINAREYSLDLLRRLNEGRLADLVIVSTGAVPAIYQAIDSLDRGGTILFFAPAEKGAKIIFPFNELFWRTENKLVSSYAGSPADYRQALGLIAGGEFKVKDMITHCFKLEEIKKGFYLVTKGANSIKIIIHPQE